VSYIYAYRPINKISEQCAGHFALHDKITKLPDRVTDQTDFHVHLEADVYEFLSFWFTGE